MGNLHDVSTMDVVTSSGVTSGGMVTSGTTCWTWGQRLRRLLTSSQRTFDTKDSLIRLVMMLDLPTPSGGKLKDELGMEQLTVPYEDYADEITPGHS